MKQLTSTSAEGSVTAGERLVNRLEPPGGKAMTFKPTVTEVDDQRVEAVGGVVGQEAGKAEGEGGRGAGDGEPQQGAADAES